MSRTNKMKTIIQRRLLHIFEENIQGSPLQKRIAMWASNLGISRYYIPPGTDSGIEHNLNKLTKEDDPVLFVTIILSIIDNLFSGESEKVFHLIPKLDQWFKHFSDRMSIPEISLFEIMKERLELLRAINFLKTARRVSGTATEDMPPLEAVRHVMVLSDVDAQSIVSGEEPPLTPPGGYRGQGTEGWGNRLTDGPE